VEVRAGPKTAGMERVRSGHDCRSMSLGKQNRGSNWLSANLENKRGGSDLLIGKRSGSEVELKGE